MEQVARHGGVLAVHGEDDELVMYNYLLAKELGLWDWYNVHLIHSKLVEDLAFQKAIRLAERTGAGMYFVHVTAQDGMDAISEARSDGLPVYGEVLTLALSFICDQYQEPDGMKYHTYPSLKYEEDRNHLWDGLMGGNLAFPATDSSFTTYVDKTAGRKCGRRARRQHRHRDSHGGKLFRGGGKARINLWSGLPRLLPATPPSCWAFTPAREQSPPAATPTSPSSTLPSRRP